MSKSQLKLFTVAFALLLPLSLLGCPSNKNTPANTTPANSPATKTTTDFDGDRAFEHVRKQVEFGPRPAGSAELERTRDYIVAQLKSSPGLNVTTDEFHPTTPQGQKKMVNVIAELPGESSDVIIISSHYDTKYYKDFNFVGANDAGSSTGALIEIARVLAQKSKPKLTYWFVFFDGEEAFCTDWEQCKNPNPADPGNGSADNTYGSRHMVEQLIAKNELKRIRAMILLDMMGSKDLRLGRPELSSRWLVDVVWQTAREAGYGKQFTDGREGVDDDDHKPFLRAGVDALDIIQLATYDEWHTKDDTLDKISAKSLKAVGDTLILSLPKIEERILRKPDR
jgi:Zn-dependent M28 family amino/carboxypeptidase